jgi:hypothetical protein
MFSVVLVSLVFALLGGASTLPLSPFSLLFARGVGRGVGLCASEAAWAETLPIMFMAIHLLFRERAGNSSPAAGLAGHVQNMRQLLLKR